MVLLLLLLPVTRQSLILLCFFLFCVRFPAATLLSSQEVSSLMLKDTTEELRHMFEYQSSVHKLSKKNFIGCHFATHENIDFHSFFKFMARTKMSSSHSITMMRSKKTSTQEALECCVRWNLILPFFHEVLGKS